MASQVLTPRNLELGRRDSHWSAFRFIKNIKPELGVVVFDSHVNGQINLDKHWEDNIDRKPESEKPPRGRGDRDKDRQK